MKKRHLNLLPAQYKYRRETKQGILCWTVLAILMVTTLVSMGRSTWKAAQSSELRRAALEREFEPITHLNFNVVRYRDDLSRLEKRTLTAKETINHQPMLTLVAAISRAAQAANKQICVRNLELIKNSPKDEQRVNTGYRLSIEGVSVGNQELTEFVNELEASDCFVSVQISSNKATVVSGRVARTYRVECRF